MPFHRKLTVEMIAARDELYAKFTVQPHQISAARNPGDPISALTGRDRFTRRPNGAAGERPNDDLSAAPRVIPLTATR